MDEPLGKRLGSFGPIWGWWGLFGDFSGVGLSCLLSKSPGLYMPLGIIMPQSQPSSVEQPWALLVLRGSV